MRTLLLLFIFTLYNLHSFSQNTTKPIVLGEIHEIQSTELSEKRILNIYLPEGYKQDDTIRYPVVYLLDGGTDEDFIHIVGIYQFNTFPWIDRVPQSIVVGIVNTDRKRDLSFPTTIASDKEKYPTAGHSDKFISFIEKELQPYIDKKFKTRSSRTIIGQSLGGLFATEVLLKKPALFDTYIIISPSIWWDNGSIMNFPAEVFKKSFSQKTGIYIGVGKEGPTPTAIPRIMEDDAKSLAEKLKNAENKKLRVYFDFLPQEDHATIMHQAVFNAHRLLYPKAKAGK